jgi:WD40 repeat protein
MIQVVGFLLSASLLAQAAEPGTAVKVLPNPTEGGVVGPLAISHDGKLLAVGQGGNVRLLDLPGLRERRVLRRPDEKPFTIMAFAPADDLIASGGHGRDVVLWDLAAARAIRVLKGHERVISGLEFIEGGRKLFSCSFDETVRIWDVASGQESLRLPLPGTDHPFGRISPDGQVVATGDMAKTGTIRLWDLRTKEARVTLRAHGDRLAALCFSPDGAFLASASADRTAKLWRVATGSLESTFSGHEDALVDVKFAPDGRMLATCALDRTIRLWDVAKTKSVATLTGHTGPVAYLAFTPDGRLLVSSGWDQSVRIWDLAFLRDGNGHPSGRK